MSTVEQASEMILPQHDAALALSSLGEQQRAIGEIQAMLTVAAARPRHQPRCIELIKQDCQREGVAAEAEYEYSKGGQKIGGASIKLMEVIAQKWGNIEYGFRELVHQRSGGGRNGESNVEAFAWDLETNTRRKVVFTVEHRFKSDGRMKEVDDSREIYELMANQAQRRVRTCLENVIPRDVVEGALEECRRTLVKSSPVTPDSLRKMVEAFLQFQVTQADIEARLQRRLDSISPGQLAGLRRIYSSLAEGISEPSDWFKQPAQGQGQTQDSPQQAASPAALQTATQQAKEAIKKAQAAASSSQAPAQPVTAQPVQQAASSEGYRPAESSSPAPPDRSNEKALQVHQHKAAAAAAQAPAAQAEPEWLMSARQDFASIQRTEQLTELGGIWDLYFKQVSQDPAGIEKLRALFDEAIARTKQPAAAGKKPDKQQPLLK